jgi:hypothetical protein
LSGTVTLSAAWTDDAKAETATLANAVSLSATGQTSGQMVMRVAPGSNVSYSTTVSGGYGTPRYALFMKLEKMD